MKNYIVTHTFKSKEAKAKMGGSYWHQCQMEDIVPKQ